MGWILVVPPLLPLPSAWEPFAHDVPAPAEEVQRSLCGREFVGKTPYLPGTHAGTVRLCEECRSKIIAERESK